MCTSETKGVRKKPLPESRVEVNFGLAGDAHADSNSHRQVSLLAIESIARMRKAGFAVDPGDFAENLTTEGLELPLLPVGTRLSVGKDIVLEITQIGKECHVGCEIFRQVGMCVMPREGVFARVIRGGVVKAGDKLRTECKDD